MKNVCVVALLVGVFLAGWTSFALAQESQLVRIVEFQVNPGMRADYEAQRKENIARLAENDFSFPRQMSVNEDGVYRQVSVIGGWEDFERHDQEVQAIAGTGGGNAERIDHFRQSILRTRPELSYAPEDPRVPGNEAGFIRYVFFYLRLGTGEEVEEILTQQSALARRHNIRDGVIVTTSVIGYDAPMLLLRVHARDREDYYRQRTENWRVLGEEGAALRRRLGGLARRIETSNNTWRRDLSYQPSN